MNKGEFVDQLSKRTGFTKKDSRLALDTFLEIVTEELKEGGEVLFTGFGKFESRTQQATERINPQTGERIDVPSKVVPKFKAGKNLEEGVREKLQAVEGEEGELEVEKG